MSYKKKKKNNNKRQTFSKKFLTALHKHSFENEEEVKNSHKCGCFSCMEIFDAKDTGWYEERSGIKTAVCPYC